MFRVFSANPSLPSSLSGHTSKIASRVRLLLVLALLPVLGATSSKGQTPLDPGSGQPKAASEQPAGTDTKENSEANNPAVTFTATAYSLRGRTASGTGFRRGVIAADRSVLPIGTRVRLEAGSYSGEYVVADTGGGVSGRKIDIWLPSEGEAMRFGRRPVKLTVLTRIRDRVIPAFEQRELERQHSENKVTDKEYRAKALELKRDADQFYKAVAQDVIRDESLHPAAIYSPVRYEAAD